MSANDCLILHIFPMDDGETREEVPMQFGISSIIPGRGECVACILVLSVVLSHSARLSASWADSDDQTKFSALDAVGEGASGLFTPFHVDTQQRARGSGCGARGPSGDDDRIAWLVEICSSWRILCHAWSLLGGFDPLSIAERQKIV
jgi:hypothetical protein